MNVFLTGATGYIGGAVAEALAAAGHKVLGLAHSDDRVKTLEAKGIQPWRGNLDDPASIGAGAARADAAIHTALGRDANAPLADRAAVESILDAYTGTGKPFIYTSGVWVMGNTKKNADETASLAAPPVVSWRMGVEQSVLDAASRNIRTVVIRPAMVYGRSGGMAMAFAQSARQTGAALMVGDGENHWTFVHIDDLADLYVRALDAPPGTLLIAADGEPLRLREVAEAASRAAGAGGKVHSIEIDEAFKTMGPWAQGIILDSRVSGRKARELLGWQPRGRSVLQELAG
jgi:nucleoside-diphosphate-sugar epimerase